MFLTLYWDFNQVLNIFFQLIESQNISTVPSLLKYLGGKKKKRKRFFIFCCLMYGNKLNKRKQVEEFGTTYYEFKVLELFCEHFKGLRPNVIFTPIDIKRHLLGSDRNPSIKLGTKLTTHTSKVVHFSCRLNLQIERALNGRIRMYVCNLSI